MDSLWHFCWCGSYSFLFQRLSVAFQRFNLALLYTILLSTTIRTKYHPVLTLSCTLFYCATLWVSMVVAVGVFLSVCQLRSYNPNGWKYCKLFSRPNSPINTVCFCNPSAATQFQRKAFSRGFKNTACGEICDFRLKSPFISEMVRDMPMFAMERWQKVTGGGSIGVGSDDLEWPWKSRLEMSKFSSNARTVWSRKTKFGKITNVGRGVYLGVSHTSHPKTAEFQRSPILGFYCIYASNGNVNVKSKLV